VKALSLTQPWEIPVRQQLRNACDQADWVQVFLNRSYGPPCFHLEGEAFCLRAQRWDGHWFHHSFISLFDLLQAQGSVKK